MRNHHLLDTSTGAQQIESLVVRYPDNDNLDHIVLYQNATGRTTALIDSFRGGEWNSVLLDPETTDVLRKALNRVHRERGSQ